MIKLMKTLLVVFYTSSVLFVSSSVEANDGLHLEFHMGVVVDGKPFIGGTLKNKGQVEIYKGFIVLTPIDNLCYPQKSIIWDFSKIPPGVSLEFKIPVDGGLHGYKLNTIYAMDNMGNKMDVVDETAEIIAKKQAVFVDKCQSSRAAR
ncbi:hypothetical protein ACET5Y_12695 [Aeromonas veronii]|uniref:hypothetical protein n=1 Tax=Aeromonas TaxID=642 RepID=UPI001C22E25C|nr:hypothetical protein [Aeromonas sp. FDAARGOS 1416]QXB01782.1 hypothetical protein I6L46_20670 [Aeromonas sp. FDAARGOS 1416]